MDLINILHHILNQDEEEELLLNYISERYTSRCTVPSVLAPLLFDKSLQIPSQQLTGEVPDHDYCMEEFPSNFCMTNKTFGTLLEVLKKKGTLQPEKYHGGHRPNSLELKMHITLWYLAHEDPMSAIASRFGVSKTTVNKIVKQCCEVISEMADRFIRWPQQKECTMISEQFYQKAKFPGVLGAIDEADIVLKINQEIEECYIDERRFMCCLRLQGVCTADRLFTDVSICLPPSGKAPHAKILEKTELYQKIAEDGPDRLFHGKYYLLGDTKYPCSAWLLPPFRDTGHLTTQQKRFNVKHSVTRAAIDTAFALLLSRWKRLNYLHVSTIDNAPPIILACCVLHNFCILHADTTVFPKASPEHVPSWDFLGQQKRNEIMYSL